MNGPGRPFGAGFSQPVQSKRQCFFRDAQVRKQSCLLSTSLNKERMLPKCRQPENTLAYAMRPNQFKGTAPAMTLSRLQTKLLPVAPKASSSEIAKLATNAYLGLRESMRPLAPWLPNRNSEPLYLTQPKPHVKDSLPEESTIITRKDPSAVPDATSSINTTRYHSLVPSERLLAASKHSSPNHANRTTVNNVTCIGAQTLNPSPSKPPQTPLNPQSKKRSSSAEQAPQTPPSSCKRSKRAFQHASPATTKVAFKIPSTPRASYRDPFVGVTDRLPQRQQQQQQQQDGSKVPSPQDGIQYWSHSESPSERSRDRRRTDLEGFVCDG